MDVGTPGVPLCARLSASEGISGARIIRGAESPSGARSANRVGDNDSPGPVADTPPCGSSGPLGAPQHPEVAQGQPPAQRAASRHTAPPPIPGQTELALRPYQPTLWSL